MRHTGGRYRHGAQVTGRELRSAVFPPHDTDGSRVTRPRLLGDGASAYLLHVQPLSNVNPSGAHFCQLLCFLSRQVWFQLPCGLWMSYEKNSPLHFASVFWKTTTIPKKKIVLAEVVRLVVSSSRQITIQHALFATFSSINNTNNPSVFWKLEKNSPHFVVVVLLWTWVFFTFWIRSIRYQMLMKTSDSSTARQRHVSMSVFVTWRQLSDFAQEGVKVPRPWLRPCCANNDGKARPQVWLCD